ncbi:hypothetical protein [Halomontanus rarus]|uniref:hypothetical protein n=1 Tax=Halomontanus rarus TaxID=3034020 RepID=UPI00293C092B|nr:hypothetical protein [Halovivax sp. KZCA124]
MIDELEQLLAIGGSPELALAFTAIFGEVLCHLILATGIRIEQSLTDIIAEETGDVVEVRVRCRSRNISCLFVVGEPRRYRLAGTMALRDQSDRSTSDFDAESERELPVDDCKGDTDDGRGTDGWADHRNVGHTERELAIIARNRGHARSAIAVRAGRR